MATKPKILLLDIETSFKIAGIWGLYKQNVNMSQVLQDTYVLCWSAKWLDDEHIYSDSLHFYKDLYKKDPTDDSGVLETMWDLLDECDYAIGHNIKRFDVPMLNARFLRHRMQPPSTYQMIDTLTVARRAFRFTSNRLGDLGETLGVGGKMDTGGYDLWKKVVMHQDKKSMDLMVAYCERDVELLEDVYKALRPWDSRHPSTVVASELDTMRCNICESNKVKKNGSYATNTNTYQKYKCSACGHNMRSRKADPKTKEQKANLLRSL